MLIIKFSAGTPAIAIPYAWVVLAALIVIASLDTFKFCSYLSAVIGYGFVHFCTTFEAEFQLLSGFWHRMEQQATNLLAVLKSNSVPLDIKLDLIDKLKAFIKHHAVPENAVNPTFDVLRLTISLPQLQDSGFSMLSHMTKRMILQEQQAILAQQGSKTYSVLLDRLGDTKDRIQLRAIHAFVDFWFASPVDVEAIIRDKALPSKNVRTKQGGMQWILRMHKEQSLAFKGYVPGIVQNLEDADGIIRDTAKAVIIELFRPASELAQSDLQRQLGRYEVRSTIVDYISGQLGLGQASVPRPASSQSMVVRTPSKESLIPPPPTPSTTSRFFPVRAVSIASLRARSRLPSLMPRARTLQTPALQTLTERSKPVLKGILKPVKNNLFHSEHLRVANAIPKLRKSVSFSSDSSDASIVSSQTCILHSEKVVALSAIPIIRRTVSLSSNSSLSSASTYQSSQNSMTSSMASSTLNAKPTPSHTPARSRDNIVLPKTKKGGPVPPSIDSADAVAPPVAATVKAELDPAKPINVESNGYFHLNRHLTADNKDRTVRLDEQCRDMLPLFEGKESEHNWVLREKNILILRKITKGNAPSELTSAYTAMIRGLIDGILKSVNSLRTTVSTNGCYLVQEAARAIGSGLDPVVEIIMQTLIKVCGHTKTINAQNGNATVTALLGNVTYSTRLLQHVLNACTDKNVRPRSYSQGWLKLIITRHINHQHVLEHGNGVDMMEKILQKGLADPDAGVRESARDAYWAFNTLWPTRGETIMAGLKPAAQGQLLQHSANPDPSAAATQVTTVTASKPSVLSRSAAAPSTTRPSLKETMLARKKEKAKIDRPDSAQAIASPVRPQPPRPATSMSTGTLSSAPLRPVRPKSAKKAEDIKLPMKPAVKKPSAPSPTKAAEDLTMIFPSMSASAPELPIPAAKRPSPTIPFFPTDQAHDTSLRPESSRRYSPTTSHFPPDVVDSAPVHADVATPEPAAYKPHDEADFISSETRQPTRISAPPASSDAVISRKENRKSLEAQRKSFEEGRKSLEGLRKSFESQRPLSELSESQTNNGNDSGDSSILRLIDSGIKRISSKTLDAHGYRKLQSTIVGHLGLVSGPKLAELVNAINARLGDDVSPADDRITTQQLMLLKLLQQGKRQGFTKYVPDSMCSILIAMGRYKLESHVQATLENTFDELTGMLEFPGAPVTEAVLALVLRRQDDDEGDYDGGGGGEKMKKKEDDVQARRTLAHCLDALLKLLKLDEGDSSTNNNNNNNNNTNSTNDLIPALLSLTLRGIQSDDSAIRKRSYALAVQLQARDPKTFEVAVAGISSGGSGGGGDRSMLMYFIAQEHAKRA